MSLSALCYIFFFIPSCWNTGPPEPQETEPAFVEPQAKLMTAPTNNLVGREFIGPPVPREMNARFDCEGCSERGTLMFRENGHISFIWRGSDIRGSGKYTREGPKIIVRSTLDDRVFIFELRNNLIEIIDTKSGAVFRDKDHPWDNEY